MFACGPFQVKKVYNDPRCTDLFIRVGDPKSPTKALNQVERYSPNPTK